MSSFIFAILSRGWTGRVARTLGLPGVGIVRALGLVAAAPAYSPPNAKGAAAFIWAQAGIGLKRDGPEAPPGSCEAADSSTLVAAMRRLYFGRWSAMAAAVVVCVGCGDPAPGASGGDGGADVVTVYDGTVPARAAGTRAPRTGRCDGADTVRCLLPWPSSTFLVADPSTPTGVRVRVESAELAAGDVATGLGRADGFSRTTPVMTAFRTTIDPTSLGDGTTASMRLVVATPGEHFGEVVPLRMHAVAPEYADETPGAVVGYPRALLRPGTDYVVAVLDSLRSGDSRPLVRDDHAAATLGLRPPRDLAEAEAFAYHAPSREALRTAGVDLSRVLRVWDFTTRSADDPRRLLRSMRTQMLAALAAGTARVEITDVTVRETGFVAAVVRGALRGLPRFTRDDHTIARDPAGAALPVAGATFEAPFRMAVPRGMGDYRVVLYGHGTGGNVDDAAFDEPISEAGAAKVGIRFDSLTEPELLNTLAALSLMQRGVEGVSSRLAQSAAGASAILHALIGLGPDDMALPTASNLREMLAQPMLGGVANPAAGRRPQTDRLAWTGGSLGGTMGMTIASAEPRFDGAVLNVPGAAWSHYLTFASLYRAVRPGLSRNYGDDVGVFQQVAMTQNTWDEVDGAAWSDIAGRPRPFLLQQSMGDPVLPNVGTEFAAAALGAVQLGAVLSPVSGASVVEGPQRRTTLTQYRVPRGLTGMYDIHGFANGRSPAGLAAREQIEDYLRSVWAGAPEITLPTRCRANTPAGSCDFSAAPQAP